MGLTLDNVEFRKVNSDIIKPYWDWRDFPDVNAFMRNTREEHIYKYGFAVLNETAINALLPLSPLVEVGAGSCYWSYELQRAGADIIATDPRPPTGVKSPKGNGYPLGPCWIKPEKLTAVAAIRKYPKRNLLTVWPSYKADWTHNMLRSFKGEFLAYVGEGEGGCTGTDEMHKLLDSRFDEVRDLPIPQFWGIHDRLLIYKRKKRHPGEGVPALNESSLQEAD